MIFESKYNNLHTTKWKRLYRLQNGDQIISALIIKFWLAYESKGAIYTVYSRVKSVIAVSPVECDY